MAKIANLEKIKYQFEKKTIEPGYYTLHRPSQCNLKFPKDNRPIHKKLKNAFDGKEVVSVSQNGKWRQMIIPKKEKVVYPAIWHKDEYKKLKEQAVFIQDPIEMAKAAEEEAKKRAEESEQRKQRLKNMQKQQPGHVSEISEENIKRDQSIQILNKAAGLRHEQFQGARIANQFILAAKCHAIRDAQVSEKALIIKDVKEEDKKLDEMMEKARIAALEKEQIKLNQQKAKTMENINNIKKQIAENEKRILMENERLQKESIKMNQTETALQFDEIEMLKKKRENALKLKELLDQANEELRNYKQKQLEDSKNADERIQKFIQQKHDREARLKAESDAKKAARAKGIDTIASAQKAEKELREELENIRLLKIQEDFEREYRQKEKLTALKKIANIEKLKQAREKQIADIRRQIALEISRDEEVFRNVLKKNEEELKKEEKAHKDKQQTIKDFRQSIIKQIDGKAQRRAELRQQNTDDGRSFLMELEKKDKLEKQVVRQKIQEMREQNIPEKYINEVEQRLTKLKYYE